MVDKIETVFFDLDGTIINSTPALVQAFTQTFEKLGYEYPGDQVLLSKFGKSLDEIIKEFEISEEDKVEFKNHFTSVELNSQKFLIVPEFENNLEKILETYGKLKLITSKRRKTAEHALKVTDLESKVKYMITADDTDRTKPQPDPIKKALNIEQLEPKKSIYYIGDSRHDVIAANKCGISSVFVTWGVHKSISDIEVDHLVNTEEELRDLLQI